MRFKFLNHEISSIHSAALLLGAAGLLSRLLGVLRDRMLASSFGAGRELDAYYAAFQIPDFMMIVFLLGAGTAAILPVFQEALAKDRTRAQNLISDLSSIFLLGSFLFSIVVFFLAPFLIDIIAPGFLPDAKTLTVGLTRWILVSTIFFGLSNIFSSVVQSFQRFLVFALAPILYNLGIMVGIVALVPIWGIKGLALGVVLGAFLHFGIQFLTVRNLGFSPRLAWNGVSENVKEILKLSFPRVLSVSLSQLTLLALVSLGSTLASGSIAVFQFAQNLYFVPIGVFAVSYTTTIFPRLSRAYVNRKADDFFQELFIGIRTILFWIMPSAVLFIVLRAHIVRVALGAGAFSWENTRLTAAVLALLALAMFSDSLVSLLIRGFYALSNTWMPLVVNIIASIISVGSAFFLVSAVSQNSSFWHFLNSLLRISDLPDTRVAGLALGFALGSFIDIWLLYFGLRRLALRKFNQSRPFIYAPILKILLASMLAGLASYYVRASFSETLPLITFMRVLTQGIIAGATGLIVYFGALFVLREEDVHSLGRVIRERLFRIKVLPKSWPATTTTTGRDI